jgi:Domain of unknown function (DUF5666)
MRWTFGGRARAALIGSGASLVILAAAVLAATPVLAADQPNATGQSATQHIGPHTHQLHGTVKTAPSGGGSTFTVTTERYGDVTVSSAGSTARGHGAGDGKARGHGLANLGDLKTGDRVVVQGRTSNDGNSFVARRVHALPAADGTGERATHLVGTITTASASSLTVKLADGSSQSVALSGDTRIRPQGKTVTDLTVDTKVTVVSKGGTATGIVIMPS